MSSETMTNKMINKVIKYKLSYFSIISTCCEKINYWEPGVGVDAGWSLQSPFMILWTYNQEIKFSDHFNHKGQRGAIVHKNSYASFHWIQQDLSLYRVLWQYHHCICCSFEAWLMLYVRPIPIFQLLIFKPFTSNGGINGSEISPLTD